MKKYFVTAIGTECGKTLVSAIVVQALHADYWKPIQAGPPRDTETVRDLVSVPDLQLHAEAYYLGTPASPHAAAKVDKLVIDPGTIQVPETKNDLVIEGAGGLLVPLNDKDMLIDLIAGFEAEIILVSNNYLGSINHTLLSAEAIRSRDLAVRGIIFNGPSNPDSESAILNRTGYDVLLRIPPLYKINKQVIANLAQELKKRLR